VLEGNRPAPRGQVQIDVCFSISGEGIVQVSATDVETGKAQMIKLTSATGLDRGELEKMIEDHRQHPPSAS